MHWSKPTVFFSILFVGVFGLLSAATSLQEGHAPFLKNLLGDVGLTVGIAPNPYNTLNDQLNQKQAQLDAEAADLAVREQTFATASSAPDSAAPLSSTWYLAAAVSVLAFLVALNFFFDWRRSRIKAVEERATIKE